MKTMGGSDKCKTHAEWLEELRNEAAELRAKSFFNTADVLDGIAVNLEAARNREFAEKIESLAATMPDIIQPVIERAIRKALKVQEQMFELASGNAAAMHEALKYVLQFDATDEAAEEDGLTDAERIAEYADHIEECQKKARAALSAPPRNCDLARDWVCDLYANFRPPASIKREMPPEWVDSVMAFCRWLVAPATAKEGREVSWDGKIYGKYRIEHTDGTPLKGKKYFVLRLDSDDPVEAARVAAAMRAYKNEPRNCDVGTAEEQEERYKAIGETYHTPTLTNTLKWAQMPCVADAEKGGEV